MGIEKKPMSVAERKRLSRQRNKDDPDRQHRKLDSLFMFGQVEVAVIMDSNNDIWFRGVDLARALEMEEPSVSIALYIHQKYTKSYAELGCVELKYRNIPGMHPRTTFVNELGMNLFIMRSRMPKAEFFSKWICGVVLPSIRRCIGLESYVNKMNAYAAAYVPEPESGYFYIATCPSLTKADCLKIGKTKDLEKRIQNYNCGRLEDDFMEILIAIPIAQNLSQFETIVKRQTSDFVRRGEILNCKVDYILNIVNSLLENGNY